MPSPLPIAARIRLALFTTVVLIACLMLPAAVQASSQVQFGVEQEGGMSDPARRPQLQDAQRDLGAKLIRYLIFFNEVATCDARGAGGKGVSARSYANPCYNWAVPDAVLNGARARGMDATVSVWGVPPWMFNGPPKFTGTSEAEYAGFVARYADFVEAAAERYNGNHGVPRISKWTIWNEPNGSFFEPRYDANKKPIGPARYAQLYDAASRRIKAVDANMLVGVGPTAPLATSFPPVTYTKLLLPLLQAAGSPIDAWAHNAYIGGQNPYSTTIKAPHVGLGNLQDITSLMDKYTVTRGKPIWVTEFGYQTGGVQKVVTLPEQAYLTNIAMMYAWQHPRIEMFIWYAMLDDKNSATAASFQTGLFMNETTGCGGTGSRICEKPAANSWRRPLVLTGVSGGKVTVWSMSLVDPARVKVYIQRPGQGWTAHANAESATSGMVYARLAAPVGSQIQVCDTRCSAIQVVAAGNDPLAGGIIISGGGGTGYIVHKQRSLALNKRQSLRAGIGFNQACRSSKCKVGAFIYAKGNNSRIRGARSRMVIVGRAKVTGTGTKRRVSLRFTINAKRQLAKGKRPYLVIRTVVVIGGVRTVMDRPITLV